MLKIFAASAISILSPASESVFVQIDWVVPGSSGPLENAYIRLSSVAHLSGFKQITWMTMSKPVGFL